MLEEHLMKFSHNYVLYLLKFGTLSNVFAGICASLLLHKSTESKYCNPTNKCPGSLVSRFPDRSTHTKLGVARKVADIRDSMTLPVRSRTWRLESPLKLSPLTEVIKLLVRLSRVRPFSKEK